jgi:hypothetical protein
MNANGQTEMMTYAEALKEGQQESRKLIADIRALAEGKGMVWSELTEEEITELIVEYQLSDELDWEEEVLPKQSVKVWQNLCVNCGIDMGDDNPRQLCQKTHCDNEEGEFLHGHEQQEHDKEIQKREEVIALVEEFKHLHIKSPVKQERAPMQEPGSKQERAPKLNLLWGDATQVLDHISRLTDRFSKLDPHFTYWLMMRIGGRPVTTFGYLPAPLEPAACKQVIGKDGCYFKMTTANTGVDFIWHDRTENHFLFWGPQQSVLEAMEIIQGRINHQPTTFGKGCVKTTF